MTQQQSPIDNFTEAYIKSLDWSKETDDYSRTLVAGNLRAFSHKLAEFIASQNTIPMDLVWYGPHPCQKCDPKGKLGTMIVKAGNGAPDDLEFDFVQDCNYPNHVWTKHNHLAAE